MKVAATPRTTTWQATIHNGAPSSHVINGVITIAAIAIRFTLRSILPSRCQLLISGPNERCSRNQLFSRVEERANAKAASSRNGVVGNNGSNRPAAPRATEVRPVSSQNILIPVSTLAVHHTSAANNNRFFAALRKCANTTNTPDFQIVTSRISIEFTYPNGRDSVVKPVSKRPQKACYYAA